MITPTARSVGGVGGLRLMSHLTPDKRPVGYSLTKKRAATGYRREDLTQFGRIPRRKIALLGLILRYGLIDRSIVVAQKVWANSRFMDAS